MAACFVAVCALAQQLPVRLTAPLSTATAKAGDAAQAVVTAGAYRGARAAGKVERAIPAGDNQRAELLLSFDRLSIAGWSGALDARVSDVDNAREKVDSEGVIHGILASETVSGKLDSKVNEIGGNHSMLGDILGALKSAVMDPVNTEIVFLAGTDLTLKLAKPLPARAEIYPPAFDAPDLAQVRAMAVREPFRTVARESGKPADIVNLMFIAGEHTLRQAFIDAGWTAAATLTRDAKVETLRALAEARGYSEAPVSLLTLEENPPELIFEKTTDTFAKRHHIRIYRRPAEFHGEAVWIAAATHDVGISFREQERTFIHRIDPRIDLERQKVIDDLAFAGAVRREGAVARTAVPKRSTNATEDTIETDGVMEILWLRVQ